MRLAACLVGLFVVTALAQMSPPACQVVSNGALWVYNDSLPTFSYYNAQEDTTFMVNFCTNVLTMRNGITTGFYWGKLYGWTVGSMLANTSNVLFYQNYTGGDMGEPCLAYPRHAVVNVLSSCPGGTQMPAICNAFTAPLDPCGVVVNIALLPLGQYPPWYGWSAVAIVFFCIGMMAAIGCITSCITRKVRGYVGYNIIPGADVVAMCIARAQGREYVETELRGAAWRQSMKSAESMQQYA
eukprot:TRINITY_DN12985_c0_g1_i1.p1 TRINITY_DN12985_c0_g1~~TRINITY_DN12985_c0_g1_i1.p1  ORF type:complete len:241 (-),score=26.81 TRINITY_DN12985_c0_g1_i1:26-748(-)